MRTDNAQDCLTPFRQVSSWASTSLAFAHLLETLLGDGARAFLTYPVLYGPRVGLSQEPTSQSPA